MKRPYMAVVLAGFVAGCATDRHAGSGAPALAEQALRGSSAEVVAPEDCDFARAACHSVIAELEMSKLAASNTSNPDVRRLARRLRDDQIDGIMELRRLVARKGIPSDTELCYNFQLTLERLAHLTDARFDRAFTEQVIKSHETAVELFEKQRCEGTDREFRSFAEKYLPQLCEHLATARAIQIADHPQETHSVWQRSKVAAESP